MNHLTTTPEQRLTELRRELATREDVYPRWITVGKISQRTADHRSQVIRDVLADLEKLYQAPPTPVQTQLFAAEQAPTKPQRGLYSEH